MTSQSLQAAGAAGAGRLEGPETVRLLQSSVAAGTTSPAVAPAAGAACHQPPADLVQRCLTRCGRRADTGSARHETRQMAAEPGWRRAVGCGPRQLAVTGRRAPIRCRPAPISRMDGRRRMCRMGELRGAALAEPAARQNSESQQRFPVDRIERR